MYGEYGDQNVRLVEHEHMHRFDRHFPGWLPSLIKGCWSTASHAVVLTLMREHYYCVYLYMLCRLMIDACC